MDKTSKGDSTFVLNGIRFLYSDNLGKLQSKTVTGKSKIGTKEPITPQKLKQLKSIYQERLADLNLQDGDKNKREKLFNRHAQHAITNINTTMKNESKKIVKLSEIK